jgi:hypothetical protein
MVRDGRGGHLGRALGHPGEDVSEDVDPAALEGRAGHDRGHGLAQAQLDAGDDQLHPRQAHGPSGGRSRALALTSALRSPHPGFCWRNSSYAARSGERSGDPGSSLPYRFAHEPHGTEEAMIAHVSGLHPRVAG